MRSRKRLAFANGGAGIPACRCLAGRNACPTICDQCSVVAEGVVAVEALRFEVLERLEDVGLAGAFALGGFIGQLLGEVLRILAPLLPLVDVRLVDGSLL